MNYPIFISFFDRDGTALTNREDSSCCNLSTYATSSAPFFDREPLQHKINPNKTIDTFADNSIIRNRGPLNDETVDITFDIG